MGGSEDAPEAEEAESGREALNISWTASESINHDRGALWYVVAVVVAIAAVGLNFWLQGINFESISTAVLIAVIFVAIMTVSLRPARELHYKLTDQNLTIEDKSYPFDTFRAFGVHRDGAFWQLTLIPIKRFGMGISMYINEDQGEEIVDAIGARLPMEKTEADILDKIVNKLKI